MSQDQSEYVVEAMEMLGAGYEHPAIEIEQEKTVIVRRNGELTQETRPAFVKISTAFKAEMRTIDPIALKVWLYIALSVNRRTGKAYPSLRTISKECDLAVNTIQAALERLESANLLTVDRQSRRFNLYEPVDYVSANKADPSVSANDTDGEPSVSDNQKTVSDDAQTVSVLRKTVSSRVIHNQRNQSNQNQPDTEKIIESANKTIDALLKNELLSPGKSWTKLPEIYHPFGKAFCAATGLEYVKKNLYVWMGAFEEWNAQGFQPCDIVEAVRAISAEGKAGMISSPQSITYKLNGVKVARIARERQQASQQQETSTGPDWRDKWVQDVYAQESANAN